MRKRIKAAVDGMTGRKPKGRAEPTEAIAERVSGGAVEKALRADLADARQAAADLEKERDEARGLLDKTLAEVVDLKDDLAAARADLKQAEGRLAAALEAKDGAEDERDRAQSTASEQTRENEALEKRVADLEKISADVVATSDRVCAERDKLAKRVADLEKQSADIVRGTDPLHGSAPELPAVPGSAFQDQARKTPHVATHMGSPVVVEADDPRHTADGCTRRGGRCAWRAVLGES